MTAVAMKPEQWFEITQLHARYAQAVDQGDWETWVDLFTADCRYRLVPRENHERGLPLATLDFESQGMLKDRAFAVRETLFHDPYRQCHVFGPMLVHAASDEAVEGESAYAVYRTKLDGASEVYNVGRVLDRIVATPNGLRFAARTFVYDSEWIPNSLIYPL